MRPVARLQPDVMRSAVSASWPSEEGPPLSFSSSSGGDTWAAGEAPEAGEPSSLPPADAAAADEESPGPRRNDAANLERAEPVSSSGQP
ncbi:hypothetical protein PC123_g9292 [Phytophthora cactorum]|nr:hypothetical protein PC123_g9292 [Phytophthora cactorum]